MIQTKVTMLRYGWNLDMLKGPGWKLWAKRIRIRIGTQSAHNTEAFKQALSETLQPVAKCTVQWESNWHPVEPNEEDQPDITKQNSSQTVHKAICREGGGDSQLKYSATHMMEPMARNAVVENRMGKPRRNASAVMAQVAFNGVCRCPLMAPQTRNKGTPPSRENAHSILNSYK